MRKIVGLAAFNALFPLMTVTYQRNFPVAERGKRVGWGMSLKVAVAAVSLALAHTVLAQAPKGQTPQKSPAPSLMLALSSALGLLALDVDLLPKVALVLVMLFESENLSKDDRKHSQPLKALDEVFHPQFPKTNATSEERLAALAPQPATIGFIHTHQF